MSITYSIPLIKCPFTFIYFGGLRCDDYVPFSLYPIKLVIRKQNVMILIDSQNLTLITGIIRTHIYENV